MLIGWAKRQKSTPSTVEGKALVSNWRSFNLFFIFQFSYKQKFTLMGNDGTKDEEINKLRALQVIHGPLPGPGLWQTWSLPGLALIVLISGVVALAFSAGGGPERKCTDTGSSDYSTAPCVNYRMNQSIKSLRQGNGY